MTVVAAVTVTTQAPAPLQPPPDQPMKVAPAAADAISVSWLP